MYECVITANSTKTVRILGEDPTGTVLQAIHQHFLDSGVDVPFPATKTTYGPILLSPPGLVNTPTHTIDFEDISPEPVVVWLGDSSPVALGYVRKID